MYVWVSRIQGRLEIFIITRAIVMAGHIWAERFEWGALRHVRWEVTGKDKKNQWDCENFMPRIGYFLIMFNRVVFYYYYYYQMNSGEKQKCSLFLYLENKFICAHWQTFPVRSPCQATWFPYLLPSLALLSWQQWHPLWASWADGRDQLHAAGRCLLWISGIFLCWSSVSSCCYGIISRVLSYTAGFRLSSSCALVMCPQIDRST